jgi:hypothetical protein
VRNRPIIEFVPKKADGRSEGLDTVVYGFAVRQAPSVRVIDLRERNARPRVEIIPGVIPPPVVVKRQSGAASWASKFAGL